MLQLKEHTSKEFIKKINNKTITRRTDANVAQLHSSSDFTGILFSHLCPVKERVCAALLSRLRIV